MTTGRQPAPRLEPLSAPVPSEGMGCGPPNHKVWLVTKQPLRFGPIRTDDLGPDMVDDAAARLSSLASRLFVHRAEDTSKQRASDAT